MPRQKAYTPEADFPHMPKTIWAEMMRRGTKRAHGGCLLWRGLAQRGSKGNHTNGRTNIRLWRPDGTTTGGTVARLAWWYHHGSYPGPERWLSTSCKDPRCISKEHLQARRAPQVLGTFPHLSDEALRERLNRLSRPGEGGCRLWTGTRHRNHGRLQAGICRVSTPTGSLHLFAHKLAWFLVHRHYPKEPQLLEHTCGQVTCINPDHQRLISRQDHRGLTDAQVVEARAAYWPPHARLNERQMAMDAPTAEQLAAWSLGMSRLTVEAVAAGKRVVPGKWRGYAKTVAHVLRAIELFRPAAELHRQAHAGKVSVETLARRFGSNIASMHGALHGVTYAHVPMPPEARAKVRREKLDRALAERREAENRAQAELDKLYRQAEGLPEAGDEPEEGPRIVSLSRRSQMADASVFLP